jgi:hypothetical protein
MAVRPTVQQLIQQLADFPQLAPMRFRSLLVDPRCSLLVVLVLVQRSLRVAAICSARETINSRTARITNVLQAPTQNSVTGAR